MARQKVPMKPASEYVNMVGHFKGMFLPPSNSTLLDLPEHARQLTAEAIRSKMSNLIDQFSADIKLFDRQQLERAIVALMAAHRRISEWRGIRTMKIGFTGSQQGMTAAQQRTFVKFLGYIRPTEFHHGDCVGSDQEAHGLVRKYLPRCKIILHPPIIDDRRAFCQADEVREVREYLVRNRRIVIECDALVATPSGAERLRSGTWATVRYGRTSKKTVNIIQPDGEMV